MRYVPTIQCQVLGVSWEMGAWLSTLPASTMSLEMQDALGCRMLWLQPGAAALSLPFLHPRRQGSQLGAGRR